MLDRLFKVIGSNLPLGGEDIRLCELYFELVDFPKNTIMEALGKVPQYLYFIESGIVRLFYHNDNGVEVTTHLAGESEFITPFLPFIHEQQSDHDLGTVTGVQVLRILRPNLAELINSSELFKKFSVTIFEQAIKSTQERANDLATLSGDQRYRKLLKERPTMALHVPIQCLASYLGIQPQSLSRIRKKISI